MKAIGKKYNTQISPTIFELFTCFCLDKIIIIVFTFFYYSENIQNNTTEGNSATNVQSDFVSKIRRKRRTYKQDLEIKTKKLQIEKLEADIIAQKKYSESMAAQKKANEKIVETQEVLRYIYYLTDVYKQIFKNKYYFVHQSLLPLFLYHICISFT